MTFYVNHPLLFLIAGILIAVVLGQSVYFLLKAMRRSKELGMDQNKIKKTIKTAAIFTIAPAVAIIAQRRPHRIALQATFRRNPTQRHS